MIAETLLACLLGAAAADEFTEQLARLGAPRADERAAAERWLEAHLAPQRYAELAAAARAGDAEVRGRLVRILSSDARHLGLALALSAEKEAGLNALGREAVRAGVASQDERLAEPAVRDGVEEELRRAASASPPRSLVVDAHLPLERLVEQLELVGELPLGLTLDPRVASMALRREEELPSGPWNEVLVRAARALGIGIEIHGLARGRENPVGAFLRLTAESAPALTGVDLVSDWLFTLAKDGDPAGRTRAACNLASAGFAPAIEWMDRLVRERADRSALEGLLLAAARGRVAPVLSSPAVLGPLLAEAEGQGGARSARILCALSRIGCFDERGDELAPRLLAGFVQATPRARWMRLLLLEHDGCASNEAAELARGLLAEPATMPALRLQALHALAVQGSAAPSAAPRVEGAGALFRLDLDELELERLGRTLGLLGLAPPYPDPAGIPADWTPLQRLRLLETWVARADAAALAAHVVAWMKVSEAESRARGEALADALATWRARGAGPFLDGVLRRAGELAPEKAAALERVRLLLGLVPAPEVAGVLARVKPELTGERADLALLAALAGYPAPVAAESEARATLLARLDAALAEKRGVAESSALIEALEQAAEGLYAAGRDAAGETFAKAVEGRCSRSKTDLGRRFERQLWLRAPLTETRDVARALARFEIPASL